MLSKYILTFDFRIIYCKNTKLKIGLKEFDFNSLKFIDLYEDSSIIDNSYEISEIDMEFIVNNIFNSKFGYQLDDNSMIWLEKFENVLKSDSSILNKKELAFNYLVLKLLLIGFPQYMALEIIQKYYKLKEYNIRTPDIEIIINRINEFIKKKEYWISNEIYNDENKEIDFLAKVFNEKRKYKYNFSFNNLRDEYFKLCFNSLIMNNYKYNSKPSFLIKNPKNLNFQKELLLEFYISKIKFLINYLLENDFKGLSFDYRFTKSLIDEMIRVINTFFDVVITKMEEN